MSSPIDVPLNMSAENFPNETLETLFQELTEKHVYLTKCFEKAVKEITQCKEEIIELKMKNAIQKGVYKELTKQTTKCVERVFNPISKRRVRRGGRKYQELVEKNIINDDGSLTLDYCMKQEAKIHKMSLNDDGTISEDYWGYLREKYPTIDIPKIPDSKE